MCRAHTSRLISSNINSLYPVFLFNTDWKFVICGCTSRSSEKNNNLLKFKWKKKNFDFFHVVVLMIFIHTWFPKKRKKKQELNYFSLFKCAPRVRFVVAQSVNTVHSCRRTNENWWECFLFCAVRSRLTKSTHLCACYVWFELQQQRQQPEPNNRSSRQSKSVCPMCGTSVCVRVFSSLLSILLLRPFVRIWCFILFYFFASFTHEMRIRFPTGCSQQMNVGVVDDRK